MTDGGAVIEPDAGETPAPFWPRSAYAGFKAFGSADGAVLVTPDTVSGLRSAAELAAREQRIAGGLLYGRGYTDGQGGYLVVDGFLEAGPGESRDRDLSPGDVDDFTLPEADLRVLRADAARMYPAAKEAGWWRTLPELGDFGPGDYLTQQELVAPGSAGLLVYGAGAHWGTAYLGPDGHAPDSAGTLVVVPEPDEQDDDEPGYDAPGYNTAGPVADETRPGGAAPHDGPDDADLSDADDADLNDADGRAPDEDGSQAAAPGAGGPGTALAPRRRAELMPLRMVQAPARTPQWAVQSLNQGYSTQPEMPLDVKIVVALLLIVPVVAAVMIGMLLSSAMIGLIVAVVCVVLVLGFVWLTRL